MHKYKYLIYSVSCEVLAGILPIIAIPIFIKKIGAEAYAESLFPLGVVALLVSILDVGINLNGLASLGARKNNKKKLIYVIATIVIKVIIGVMLAIGSYIIFQDKVLNGHWCGAFLLYLGYSLYPSWLFIVTKKVMLGQLISAIGRGFPIILLFIILEDKSNGEEINIVMGALNMLATLISYKFCLSEMYINKIKSRKIYILLKIQMFLLVKENSKFWITQILQSGYRTVLPVLAGSVLNSIEFVAYNIGDKILKAVQKIMAYYLQNEFGKIEKKKDNDEMINKIFYLFKNELIYMMILMSLLFYIILKIVAPYISGGDINVIKEIENFDWLLPIIVIVGACNYWFGALLLPVLKKPNALIYASSAAALISLALASRLGVYYGTPAVMASMLIGELIFIIVVINEFKKFIRK